LVGLCFLVIVLPAGKKENNAEEMQQETGNTIKAEEEKSYAEQLEARVESLLSSVQHVGKVKVMITVASTEEKVILKDGQVKKEETQEADSAGGTRYSYSESTETETVFQQEEPYLIAESYPEVIGVVVIAEGTGTGTVDYEILNAVQVLFHLPAHKIKIMKMK